MAALAVQPIGFNNVSSNCHMNALMQALLTFEEFRRTVQLIPQNLEITINAGGNDMPMRVINHLIRTVKDCSLEGGQDSISVDLFYLIDTFHKNLSNLFLFEVEKNLKCRGCGHAFKKMDSIHILNPTFDIFNNYLKDYKCDACGRRGTTVNDYLTVVKYPTILICSANVPGQIPAVAVRQLGKRRYTLRSLINYPGRAHFTATVKYPDGKIYYCDDSAVRQTDIILPNANTLFCFYLLS